MAIRIVPEYQTTNTMDNAHLSIDFLVYSKIVDVMPSVLNVEDNEGASRGIAITTLRAVVGNMVLDDPHSPAVPRIQPKCRR